MTSSYQQVLDNRLEEVNAQIQAWPSSHKGKVSDGFHTFDELYDHRITLFAALAWRCAKTTTVWRFQTDSDWFLAGIGLEPGKQISYHLPMSVWSDWDFAYTPLEKPEWDGHTSADVLERLKNL